MVCNKKAFSDLKKDCETCEEREECFSGLAVGVGYLESCAEMAAADLTQPLLMPHDYRDIKVAQNTTITIDVEEMKRQLAERFNPMQSMLNYGA